MNGNGKNGDISEAELTAAFEQDPGSNAYAQLAEHYVEKGALDQALETCAKGFKTNPKNEKGVLVYLSALKRAKDINAAAKVYGNAIAENPKSTRIRLAWAYILLDSGNDKEAKRRTREALDLDPKNPDGRSLMAKLGGVAPSIGGRGSKLTDFKRRHRNQRPIRVDNATPFGETKIVAIPAGTLTDSGENHSQITSESTLPSRQLLRNGPIFGPPLRTDTDEAESNELESNELTVAISKPTEKVNHFQDEFEIEEPETAESRQPPVEEIAPQEEATRQALRPAPHRKPIADPNLVLARAVHKSRPKPRGSRTFLVITGIILAAAAAYLWYARKQSAILHSEVSRLVDSTISDSKKDFEHADMRLSALLSQNPDDDDSHAALALINAHLWARFGRDPEIRHDTTIHLQKAGQRRTWSTVAAALLHLGAGETKAAKLELAGANPDPSNWHWRFANALLHFSKGKIAKLNTLLEKETETIPPAPALLHLSARIARFQGHWKQVEKAVKSGLKANPTHPGLMIEDFLYSLHSKKQIDKKTLSVFSKHCTLSQNCRGGLAILNTHLALKEGRWKDARKHARTACQSMPRDPEAAFLESVSLLLPGGDVARGFQRLRSQGSHLANFSLHHKLWDVKALLALGRPHEAEKTLEGIPRETISSTQLPLYDALAIRCAHHGDRLNKLRELCTLPNGASLFEKIACIEAHFARSQTDNANNLLKTISKKKHPNIVRYLLGLRNFAQGDARRAIRSLASNESKDLPDREAPLIALGQAYSLNSDLRNALKTFRRAVTRDAQSSRSQVLLAETLVKLGELQEAQPILTQVASNEPSDPAILAKAGELFLALGKNDEAREIVRKAVAKNPHSSPIRMLAGRVALVEERWEEAKKMFSAVLKREPQSPEALVELGRVEAALGNLREANKFFAAALKIRPRDPVFLSLVAQAYAKRGYFKQSAKYGKRALELLRLSNRLHLALETKIELGQLFAKGNRWAKSKAIVMLGSAAKSKDSPATLFLTLGRLHREQKQLTKAAKNFDEATIRDPKFAIAFWELGMVLVQIGKNPAKAKRSLETFLRLRPNSKKAAQTDKIIRQLKTEQK